MKQWFIKTFRKRVAVKLYVVTRDGRITPYWTIPNSEGEVFIGDYAYKLNSSKMLLEGRTSTYVCHIDNAEPLNLTKRRAFHYTAVDFKRAIDSHVASDILTASKGQKLSTEMLVLGLIMFLGFAGLVYYMNEKFATLLEYLQQGGL